ncbi:MAG: hypothetical protein MRY83_25035 [Flavobacteriales bacterium]|nr:hypothetical protein [Flavobacteriales bacterium]
MAKARIVSSKKSIQRTIQSIIKNGSKPPIQNTVSKGPINSKVASVQASRVPKPAQNQRGRIISKDGWDLTR